MDMTAIASLTSAISAAREIAQGAIGIRDATLVNEVTSRLVQKLLDAQNALLAHNAALLQLQNEHFEAREELRKLQEAASERGRYALVEVSPGQFAYRVNIAPEQSGAGEPGGAEPMHYVCQPCLDKGIKAVLNSGVHKFSTGFRKAWICPVCGGAVMAQ